MRRNGDAITISAPKQRALLCLLLVHVGEVLSPDRLIDALWGDDPPRTADKNLQVLVARLRDVLELDRGSPTLLCSEPGGYRIVPASVQTDTAHFGRLLVRAREANEKSRWEDVLRATIEALALVRGRPLSEFGYEDWAASHVTRLEDAILAARELRIAALLELGEHGELVPELEALVVEHPTRERFRAQLMLALYRAGRQADALDAYHAARETLLEELGLEPGPELRELQRRVLEQDPSLDVGHLPRVRALPSAPVPRTSLVGRTHELDELADLLEEHDVRLLTLTGWGGVGKTRVATELARRLARHGREVAWVELAPVADADLVVAAVQAAFGIGGVEGDPVDAVAQAVGNRRLLLFLDNFEHVMDARDVVARLVDACPAVQVVTTSRGALDLYGEREYGLRPFSSSDAVELFAQRSHGEAGATGSDDIARICERVDRLPLAIELAAARTRLLSPAEILERLDRRLGLLTSGPADRPDRQRSLRAAIEWSYDLLDDHERTVFRALGAFVGGCTVEAAIHVAGGGEFETLDVLESLVAKHLVSRDTDALGEIRLTMLETIAEFARELLQRDPTRDEVHDRLAQMMLRYAEAGNTYRWDDEGRAARKRLSIEMPNVRYAVGHATPRAPDMAGSLVANLLREYLSGTRQEGASLAAAVLEHAAEMRTTTLGPLHLFAGLAAHHAGDLDGPLEHFEVALRAFAETANQSGIAETLNAKGEHLMVMERFDEAQAVFEEGLGAPPN